MLRSRVTQVMTREDRYPCCSLATPLQGISVLYGGLMHLRRRLYARRALKSRRLPCPVISVGNLTLGGTGKTPMVIHLAEMVLELGCRPVILSRGYKGLSEKSGAVVSDGRNLLCDARQAGDEPYLMAALLPTVPVMVGKNRYRCGLTAVRRFRPDLILLDDGYQHLQLKRDLNLLLLDAQVPFGNGHLLPRGTLREPAAALMDADAVVLTRSKAGRSREQDDLIRRLRPRPVFSSDHQPVVRMVLGAGQPVSALTEAIRPDIDVDFRGRWCFAFAGLGRNDAFFRSVALLGADLKGVSGFDDHHAYDGDDLSRIVEAAVRAGATCLITTDKDFVRLPPGLRLPLELIVMGAGMDFGDQRDAWREFIGRFIRDFAGRRRS